MDPTPETIVSQPPSSLPRRLRLSRRRGAKLPDGAISVARPGRWGNPFRVVHAPGEIFHWVMLDRENGIPFSTASAARRSAVTMFRESLTSEQIELAAMELRGRDLACHCALDLLCHADVLLEVANG